MPHQNKNNKTELYLFKTPDGRFLAEMFGGIDNRLVVGAVAPGIDGNYYKQIFLAGRRNRGDNRLGAEGWLEWLKGAIIHCLVDVDSDFDFDVRKIKIVPFVERAPKKRRKSRS